MRIDVIRPGRSLVKVTEADSSLNTPTSGGVEACGAAAPPWSPQAASAMTETAQIAAPAERISFSFNFKPIK
ncbi:hypothetical protein SSBR45G_11460 [Bradyrhizobium sp. SSBR45G]|nr:hypothetical protein SSBR45G_11460 [Bradyrhizobium sp. SSBR45G]